MLQNWLLGSRLGQKLTHPTSHLACSRDILSKNQIWTILERLIWTKVQISEFQIWLKIQFLYFHKSFCSFGCLKFIRTKMANQWLHWNFDNFKTGLNYFEASAIHSSKFLNEPEAQPSLVWTVLCKEIFQM